MTVNSLPPTIFYDPEHVKNAIYPPKLAGYELYRQVFGSAKLIVAPMVDQSELAWRILSRRYGTQLVYTPMLHSRLLLENDKYIHDVFSTNREDRPLIVQLCANDPDILLKAAMKVAPYCDAVDLNLGCPQGIARKGHYGAYLQEDWNLIAQLISTLHKNLPVPVTAKIRVFNDTEKTLAYARMVHAAGAQLITVHGRTREQKGQKPGPANWDMIKMIRDDPQMRDIPIIANGNIQHPKDVLHCLEYTGCDGVMSAEANLSDPSLFAYLSGSASSLSYNPSIPRRDPIDLAIEYLDICRQTPTQFSSAKSHIFRLLRPWFSGKCDGAHDLRDQLHKSGMYINRKTMIVSDGACDAIVEMLNELRRRIDMGVVTATDNGLDTLVDDTKEECPEELIRLEDGHMTMQEAAFT